MLFDTTLKRLNALQELSTRGRRINGLFRLMDNPMLWMQAYAKISSNNGAMTKGIDNATMDGFSDERAINIIKMLKEGRYQFKPVRRVYIPKPNGKERPLGIPSADDKLVQEVVRAILERIYEPIFRNSSHGFRPRRSCHTALKRIQSQWTGVKWIIDMDIKGYFDNIDHDIIMRLLERKIADKRFLELIKAMLKAGYLENWKFHATHSGTPQGGIISPLLANIYLHELDLYMDELRSKFNRGTRRKVNPEYKKIESQIRSRKTKINNCRLKVGQIENELNIIPSSYEGKEKLNQIERWQKLSEEILTYENEIRELQKVRREIPSGNPFDKNYRKLFYCRYADDFVIGIIGSKEDAERIKQEVAEFVSNQLHLQIEESKSGIRHASEPTRFLGYDLKVYSGNKIVKTIRSGRVARVRAVSDRMQLHIPEDKLRAFCSNKGYGKYDAYEMSHRNLMLLNSDAEIIQAYNSEIRGIANYYTLANSAKKKLSKLYGIWLGSLLKTLAYKHKTSVRKIAKKLKTSNGDYVLTIKGKIKTHSFRFFRLSTHTLNSNVIYAYVDHLPQTPILRGRNTELVKRIEAQECEYCGREKGYFEVHHIRKMKDVRNGKKSPWKEVMAAKNRKTLVLCVDCHQRLTNGTLPSQRKICKVN